MALFLLILQDDYVICQINRLEKRGRTEIVEDLVYAMTNLSI